jgi:hypothetical protein
VAASYQRQLFITAVMGLFAALFLGYLAYTIFLLFSGNPNTDLASLAPGFPGIFLFFLARKQWRSAQAARRWQKRQAERD